MKRISFVPGVVVSPAAITIPADMPDIDAVVSAQIVRLPAGLTVPTHPQADVVAALASHAVHAHDLVFGAAQASAVTSAVGGPPGALGAAAAATVAGGGATGVQNLAAAQAHADGAAPVAHGANVGASPVVAAVPTMLTTRTLSLDVNTALGDLLTLAYREVGERVLVS